MCILIDDNCFLTNLSEQCMICNTQVRVYNLAKQALAKKLIGGSGVITCIDIHPGGDNLIVGCADNRLLWFDMDLSTKPYR